MKFFPCLLLGLFSLPLFGQFQITGRVLDAAGVPLPFANVRLFHPAGDNLISGNTTNTSGDFSLTVPGPGKYRLVAGYLGYTDAVQTLAMDDAMVIPDISLSPAANALAEVVVKGDRPVIEQREDKLLFNVAASPLKTGYNGLEVLERSPNVWLSDEGALLVRNAAALVLVNGRPLRLEPAALSAYLQAIPSENILRIEVQTSAGAATTADVAGGVVNIILKKPVRGVNGQGRTAYLLRGEASWSVTSGLSLNYGGKNWNVYGNYDYLVNYRNRQLLSTTDYFTTDNFLDDRMVARDSLTRHTYRVGAVVIPHPDHVIGAELSGNTSVYNFDQLNSLVLTEAGELKESGTTRSLGFQDRLNTNATLNYTWTLDTSGTRLQVFADYTRGNISWLNSTDSRYDQGFIENNEDRNLTDNQTEIRDLQADFNKSTGKGLKFNGGLKWTSTNRFNVLQAASLLPEGWVTNERSNSFDYGENVLAAYGSFSKQLNEKDFFRMGLRAEQTHLTKTDLLDASVITQRYLNWFPSVFLSRKITDNTTLSVAYTKRVRRPSFSDLNDNVWKLNDFRYELGNPDLTPEFWHRYEVAAQVQKHQFALFYNKVADAINGIYFLEGEVAYYKKFNEGSQTEYGLEYSSTIDILPWWSMRTSARLFNRQFNDGEGQESFKQATSKFRIWHNLKLSATTRAEIRMSLYSPQADAYFIREPLREVDAMIQQQLLAKRFIIRLHIRDIFHTLIFANRRPFDTFVTTSDYRPFTRTFNLRLTYNFSGKQQVSNRNTQSKNETRQRM
ncbi:TonB-dependent receptor domain-containing protein [Neolewinella persica]|uniref:TonB-dependent receptor domain-containing protein n=1 Tax=Neolewinella persica TaxID=70998 RepID=UPI0003A3E620|nr:TonB-dependent receptor [Neolewinella persica]